MENHLVMEEWIFKLGKSFNCYPNGKTNSVFSEFLTFTCIFLKF